MNVIYTITKIHRKNNLSKATKIFVLLTISLHYILLNACHAFDHTISIYGNDAFSSEELSNNSTKKQPFLEKNLSVKGCRGEYETVFLTIHTNDKQKIISIKTSDLQNSDGKQILSSVIDVRLVKYWYQAGNNTIRNTGQRILTPELLLHDDELIKVDDLTQKNYLRLTVNSKSEYVDISSRSEAVPHLAVFNDSPTLLPFSLNPGERKQISVTIRIPDTVLSGIYRGDLTFFASEKIIAKIGLELEILPFDLVEPIVDFGIYYRGILEDNKVAKISSEIKTLTQYKAEMKDLYDHGISYPTIYQRGDNPSLNQALEIRNQFGFHKDRLFTLGLTTEKPDDLLKSNKFEDNLVLWNNLAAKFGYQTVYIYGKDEAVGEQLVAQRSAWQFAHRNGIKIFSAVYEGAVKTVGDVLDLPILSGFKPEEVEMWHKRGAKVYCYGAPQVGIEDSLIYREMYGFRLWQGGYDGCMLYAYQHGFGDIWNDFDDQVFRDHVFAYPTSSGVIDTIQWEGFREAVDDIRYLSTALAVSGTDGTTLKAELHARLADRRTGVAQIRLWLIDWIKAHMKTAVN